MKLRYETLFLSTVLCLCWPLGVLLLIKSDKKQRQKWLMAISGLLIFCALLFPAFIQTDPPVNEADFDITVTRETLSVGQSGGISVTNGNYYYTDYSVECNNDLLTVNNGIYTAAGTGSCLLSVTFKEETRSIEITVTDDTPTDRTVYASPTGERYHSSHTHAGANGLPFSEEEALRSGKTPCKICWK